MRAALAGAIAVLLLAACVGARTAREVATHDLGELPALNPVGVTLPVREVEVRAPSWLDGNALQYRLAYESDTRRYAYRDSRWVAAPAELLAQALRKAIAGAAPAAGGCRLRIALDEFEQRFDAPGASRALLVVRVELLAPRADRPLAARRYDIERAAASADAKGGAAALSAAAGALTLELRDWLNALDRAGAQAPGAASTCRGG